MKSGPVTYFFLLFFMHSLRGGWSSEYRWFKVLTQGFQKYGVNSNILYNLIFVTCVTLTVCSLLYLIVTAGNWLTVTVVYCRWQLLTVAGGGVKTLHILVGALKFLLLYLGISLKPGGVRSKPKWLLTFPPKIYVFFGHSALKCSIVAQKGGGVLGFAQIFGITFTQFNCLYF